MPSIRATARTCRSALICFRFLRVDRARDECVSSSDEDEVLASEVAPLAVESDSASSGAVWGAGR